MRIAQIAPLHDTVEPSSCSGTQRVVSFLTDELVAMGHEVTLFASGDSKTTAELYRAWPLSLRLDPGIRDTNAPLMLLMETVCRRAAEFDVMHFHMGYWPFSLFSRQSTAFVTTLHGRLDSPELRSVFDAFPAVPVIGSADSQRQMLPQARWMGAVPPGLPASLLLPQTVAPPGYLAFLGRLAPEEGVVRAIHIARACGLPLRMAARIGEGDRPYVEAVIRPMLDSGEHELLEEISDAQKPAFLSGAIALLVPGACPDPADLALIEAMSCGTPTIAFGRGAASEVIEQGRTGFVVENERDAVSAVFRCADLPRAAIRAAFLARFTARRMAEDYLVVYRRLANEQQDVSSIGLARAAE